MRTLYGYVLRELIPPTLLGLALFTFILLMDFMLGAAELIINQGVDFYDVGRLLVYALPHLLVMTVPMAILLGGLIGFGRMSTDSEVVAMRSGGVSVYQLAVPLLLLAAVGWAATAWMAAVGMPWGNNQTRQLMWQLTNRRTLSEQIKPRVFQNDFPGWVLRVDELAQGGDVWEGVFLVDTDSEPWQVITAERAVPFVDEEEQTFWLRIENGNRYEVDRQQQTVSAFQQVELPLMDISPRQVGAVEKDDRSLTLGELRQAAAEARTKGEPAAGYLVEIHKKYAFPLACLVFGLLALPLGISSHRRTRSTGFVLAIGVIVVYYALVENGEKFAEEGVLEPWLGLWSGNLVLGAAALVLLWKRAREADWGLADRAAWAVDWLVDRWKAFKGWRRDSPGRERAHGVSGHGGGFPRLLDRYVLGQFVRVFLLAQAGLATIWILIEYMERSDDFYGVGADAGLVIEYLLYELPYILHMTLPLVLLVTVLTVFSLMARSNEVVAVLSGGTSLYRLTLPILLPAVILTVGDYMLQDYVLPFATQRTEQIRAEIYPDRGGGSTFRPAQGRWAHVDGPSGRQVLGFADYDEEAQVFQGLTIYYLSEDGSSLTRMEYADRAVWEATPGSDEAPRSEEVPGAEEGGRWIGEDGFRSYFGQAVQEFPVQRLPIQRPPSYFGSEAKLPDQMTTPELYAHILNLEERGFDATRFRVDLHKKVAYPAILLVMALVAIPFGFKMGRQGTLSGIGLAIGLAVTFWIAFTFFGALGKAEVLPPALAAWATHLVFLSLAGYLTLDLNT